MHNLRALWTGALLLTGSAILCADAPLGGQWRVGQVLDFPGQEIVIGKVWFNMEREREGHAYFKPLMTPTLGMGRLKGSDNPPLGLLQCTVIRKAAILSPDVVVTATKALCPGGREYVVDEVLFDISANTVPSPVKH
jgi:hypothetical protein